MRMASDRPTTFATMGSVTDSADATSKLEDLSGVKLKPGENPYNALVEACNDDPVE